MNFCNKCGAQLTDENKFCPKCGAKINGTNISEKERSIKKKNAQKERTMSVMITTGAIIIIGALLTSFIAFKDPLLYSYHYNKALSEATTNIKLTEYNKALRYEQNKEVLNSLFTTLKDDSNFENEINSLSNLNDNNKSNLLTSICIYRADNFVENENYSSALKMLKTAEKYEYNIKSYPDYKKIEKYVKVEEEKEKSKEKPKPAPQTNVNIRYSTPVVKLPQNIYTYSDDYIIYNSDRVYLTRSDLSGYSKQSLALIRNEIYARHGYMFQTEPFKSYFNSKSWYSPNPYFSDSQFNNCETKNIALILEMERS